MEEPTKVSPLPRSISPAPKISSGTASGSISSPASAPLRFRPAVSAATPRVSAASPGVPAGFGIVEGGTLPYLPSALAQRQRNLERRATEDPEAKCYQVGVPRIVWQAPHPFARNSFSPCCCSDVLGGAAGAACARSHASNSAGGIATSLVGQQPLRSSAQKLHLSGVRLVPHTSQLEAAARLSSNINRFNLAGALRYRRQLASSSGPDPPPQLEASLIGSGRIGKADVDALGSHAYCGL